MENETLFFSITDQQHLASMITQIHKQTKKSTFLILVIKAKNPLGTFEQHTRGRGQLKSHPRKQGDQVSQTLKFILG